MLEYIVLAIICVGMVIFSVGAVFLTIEEKQYKIDVTDDRDIL